MISPGSQIPSGITGEVPETSSVPDSANVYGELEFTPDFGTGRQAVNLKFDDINYSIGPKVILKGISGYAAAHEVCALMGPSGAGKSSLLNCLSGRIVPNGKRSVSGTVTVNDKLVSPLKFRKNVAYVMQEDALYATSTTREALEFSARLRLPKTVSSEERRVLVDSLLDALGLRHVENTFCGSTLVRGLSGGEKKRVSIGVELVTNPRIIFLDEPTSGLDSYSAWKVVMILKALAKSGCTVLCTIHQPSSEIFNLFNRCMILARGEVMYNGSVNGIAENLQSLGHKLPPLTNPADFVMVLAQKLSGDKMIHFSEDTEFTLKANGNSWRPSQVRRAAEVFESGEAYHSERHSTRVFQLTLLAKREFLNLGRDKAALFGRFGVTVFLNTLFGCIFFQVGDQLLPGYFLNSHFGAIVNLFISALFGAAQPPLLTFALERVVFLREYSTGTYSSVPYLLSKLMTELPLYFVQALLVMLIVYWLEHLNGNFMVLVLELFVLMIVASSYAFLMGALVTDVKQAQELSPVIFVPQLLFSGFFIRIEQIPAWLSWCQYLCALKYGINLVSVTEFGGNMCAIPGNETLSAERVSQCQDLLESNDVQEDLVWLYLLIMLAIFLGFRVSSCAALIYRARDFGG